MNKVAFLETMINTLKFDSKFKDKKEKYSQYYAGAKLILYHSGLMYNIRGVQDKDMKMLKYVFRFRY